MNENLTVRQIEERDKEQAVDKAFNSYISLQKGCCELVVDYLRDRGPSALEYFFKQTVKMRSALHCQMLEINRFDKDLFDDPTNEVNQIMRWADKKAKKIVFGNPLWEDEIVEYHPEMENGRFEITKSKNISTRQKGKP